MSAVQDILDAAERYGRAKAAYEKAAEGVTYERGWYLRYEQRDLDEARQAFEQALRLFVVGVIDDYHASVAPEGS